MPFACFLIRNSSLSLIKRQSKSILLKLRNTTSPNDRFGFKHVFARKQDFYKTKYARKQDF